MKVTASDGTLSVSDTFNIAVGNTNDAPVIQGVGGTVTVAEDASVLLQAPLAQVTDADGDTLTMTLGVSGGRLTPSQAIFDAIAGHALTSSDSDGSDGTLSVTGSAAAITAAIQAGITYAPNANVNGLDALDVAITDGQATATASVAINITPVNDAPVTSPVTLASIAEDSGPRLITQAQLLVNASDVDGPSPLTAINLQISAGSGSLDDNGNGTWTYHPALNDSSSVSFSYSVTDGVAAVATTASLDITPVNDAPVTSPVTLASIAEDSGPRLITQAELLVNASDVDGPSPLTAINLQISAGSGSLDDNGNGTWTYHPALNDDTSVTFSYAVTDGVTPVTTSASLDITPVNDAPVVAHAIADQNATQGSAFSFQFAANTFNDVDVGDTLTYTATLDTNAPLPVWLSFDAATRTFSGTPQAGDISTVAVKVTASDGTLSVSDTFNIAVGNTNDAPVIQGVGGTVTVAEDASVLLQAPLAQVTDADGDTLTMTLGVSGGRLTPSQAILDAIAGHALTSSDSDGSDGTLSVTGSAAAITAAIQAGITYEPNANVNGLDALDVAITDGQAPATASVAINITPVNDAPVTSPVTLASIAEDSGPRLITQAQLLVNASDVDGPSPLTAINLQISAGSGSLDDNGNGTWTYHPALNDSSSVSFSYSVTDGVAAVATTASLDITPVNDAPVTSPVTLASIAEDSGPRLITQAELLVNASDVDGPSPLTAINLQISAGSGSLDDNGNGTWTYHPALNDDTSVTFSYAVTDGVTPVTTSASLDIIDTAAPAAVATVTGLSADTGTVGDFITSVASQTVSGSYTGTLLSWGEDPGQHRWKHLDRCDGGSGDCGRRAG